ncbi:MAG: hypothetical protein GY711_30370 [bacterium]|nr:hypothetical protein [bacterium]
MSAPMQSKRIQAATYVLAFAAYASAQDDQAPKQDPKPPIVPPTIGAPAPVAEKPLLATDGKPVAPGRIPSDAEPEAVALWNKMLAATRAGGAEAPPIRSFDLTFDVRIRREGGNNNFETRFAFLDEADGYILGKIDRKDRTSMRGPKGDWQIEGDTKVELDGREHEQSVRTLDEWVSIARNYIALTRPGGVRIVGLSAPKIERVAVAADVTELVFGNERVPIPDRLVERAKPLEWLEVKSPDFRLYSAAGNSSAGTPVYRALLGLVPATGEVAMAVLNEDRAGAKVVESSLLVDVPSWLDGGDGYRVPQHLRLHQVVLSGYPLSFEPKAGTELYLHKGRVRLNPRLSARVFEP